MPSSGIGSYSVKIHQIAFGGLFFLAVAMAVRAMAYGGTANVKLLAAASIGVSIVLALDKYYWVLCPFLFASGISIPGLPFDGKELGVLSLVGVHFIRQAMRKERPIRLTGPIVAALPIFAWIVFIWCLNPTGIAMFGSSSIGARFYVQIILGLLALLVLSTLRFTERDCQVLFYVLLLAAAVAFARSIINQHLSSQSLGGDQGEATNRYELLGVMPFYTLLFARYSLRQITSSLWRLLALLGLAAMAVYTGKRRVKRLSNGLPTWTF